MDDKEIMGGRVSFLRRPRKLKQHDPNAIRMAGLKSFAYQKRTINDRKQPAYSKTFSKGLVKSLLHKK